MYCRCVCMSSWERINPLNYNSCLRLLKILLPDQHFLFYDTHCFNAHCVHCYNTAFVVTISADDSNRCSTQRFNPPFSLSAECQWADSDSVPGINVWGGGGGWFQSTLLTVATEKPGLVIGTMTPGVELIVLGHSGSPMGNRALIQGFWFMPIWVACRIGWPSGTYFTWKGKELGFCAVRWWVHIRTRAPCSSSDSNNTPCWVNIVRAESICTVLESRPGWGLDHLNLSGPKWHWEAGQKITLHHIHYIHFICARRTCCMSRGEGEPWSNVCANASTCMGPGLSVVNGFYFFTCIFAFPCSGDQATTMQLWLWHVLENKIVNVLFIRVKLPTTSRLAITSGR